MARAFGKVFVWRWTAPGILGGWLALAASPVVAQQAAAPPDASAPATSPRESSTTTSDRAESKDQPTTVTVKGHRTSIDRDTYDVTKLPDHQTGTALDLLRKVPGLVIDPAGKISYHGQPVTIYLNGHPSLMLAADNRSIALQATPASYISSVEIISNPGAQFSSSDGNTIINIVTNHDLPMGVMGGVSISAPSAGGYQIPMNLSYHAGKLSLTGSVAYFDFRNKGRQASTLTQLDATGQPTTTTATDGRSIQHSPMFSVSTSFQYDLTKDDTLTGDEQYSSSRMRGSSEGHHGIFDGGGIATEIFDEAGDNSNAMNSESFNLAWVHYGAKPDEKLTVSATASRNTGNNSSTTTDTYTLSALPSNLVSPRLTDFLSKTDTRNSQFRADYTTSLGADQISTGVQIMRMDDRNANQILSSSDDGSGLTSPVPGNLFDGRQSENAAYFNYQKEFGARLVVLGELRLENTHTQADQRLSDTSFEVSYTRLNPSLFVAYVLSSDTKLRFSYVHRIQLPSPNLLNGNLILTNANSAIMGDPHLKPQDNDSFEIKYDHNTLANSYGIHGFYRETHHELTMSSKFIPDPQNAGNQVLETSSGNFGSSNVAGIETSWSRPIGKKLMLSINVTAIHTTTHTPDITSLTLTSINSQMFINYILPNKDMISFSYFGNGKQLYAENITKATSSTSLYYNHTITPKLSLYFSADNLMRAGKFETTLDTPTLQQHMRSSTVAPTFTIGLNWHFNSFKPVKRQ